MVTLFEPANGQYYGGDSLCIKYAGVSSCITLTYYYPDGTPNFPRGGLVGVHFAMLEPAGGKVNFGTIYSALGHMDFLVSGARPAEALLIGQVGFWDIAFPERIGLLRTDVRAKLRRAPLEWNTESLGAVDIMIHTFGLIEVLPHGTGGVRSRNFRTNPWVQGVAV